MKTQEEKLQHVKGAAGEKWHIASNRACICGNSNYLMCPFNPSPGDLNELFRLAEKLGFDGMHFYKRASACMIFSGDIVGAFTGYGDTPAEALLNALFIATGGKEK